MGPGDEDWASVRVCAGGTLDARVSFTHALGDVDLQLLDASSPLVTSNGLTDSERVTYTTAAEQTLYVRVYGFSGASNTYRLTLDVIDCNRTPEQARPARAGRYAGERVESGLDEWYSFTTCAGGALDAQLSFSHAAGDVDMQLFDAQGSLLSSSLSLGDSERVGLAPTAAGVLYVRVYGFSGAANAYELRAAVSGCSPTRETAAVLPVGAFGPLSAQSGVDGWFSFEVCAGGAATLTVDFVHSEGDLDLEVQTPEGAQEASRGLTNQERVSFTSAGGGVSYARVYGFAGAANDYTATLSVAGCP